MTCCRCGQEITADRDAFPIQCRGKHAGECDSRACRMCFKGFPLKDENPPWSAVKGALEEEADA